MIFYISGTGNSLYAAKNIAENSGEELISISFVMNSAKGPYKYTLKDKETIGFIYPVYAWAPPQKVLQFIENLDFANYQDNFVFSLATCGENIGDTMKILAKALKKKDLQLHSAFSLKMPNNYIIMGNVDSKEEAQEKQKKAEESLVYINQVIKEQKRGIFELRKGFLPALMTGIVNPLFNKNAIDTRKFYATDKCTSCGICEKVCNSRSIKVEGKPKWGKECIQCLACIHYCPVGAIQYGKGTQKKGRYTNPRVTIDDIFN